MATERVLLEVCVDSVADALAVAGAGADRIELCSALSLGGLTPSHGALAEVKRLVERPVMAMIRPRESGFCYSDAEFATMCRDADLACQLGADGIVFGILDERGRIDEARCRKLRTIAGNRQAVFHRAFDLVPDPLAALGTLVDLGFTRILTSGQQPTAIEGAGLIRQLNERAAGRIEILPGGGLNETNVAEFVRSTGCRQVHMGLAMDRLDPSIPADSPIRLGGPGRTSEQTYRAVDPQRVSVALGRLASIA
jgi:copper homeostasis protein